VGAAERGRGGVVEPVDGRDVVFDPIVGERLHEHHGTIAGNRLGCMRRCGNRIAQVVLQSKDADQVVAGAGIFVRPSCSEGHLGNACLSSDPSSIGHRFPMRVEAAELRGWKGLGHKPRRMPIAAANIGHESAGLELLDDPIEGRQPLRNQAAAIGIAVERCDPAIEPVANPLEEMIRRSGRTGRTFKRRFTSATGFSPIAYVQRLRIENAKRRLERTEAAVDEISWQIGYEEPAFFRRLFKRITGLAPGAYRRRFKTPDYARPAPERLVRFC
jgi:AraC-like DNA-binding protein